MIDIARQIDVMFTIGSNALRPTMMPTMLTAVVNAIAF